MDFTKFIEYATELGEEMSLLAEVGHKEIVLVEDAGKTACVYFAVGTEEAALLNRMIAKIEADPEMVAYRARNQARSEAQVTALTEPERN